MKKFLALTTLIILISCSNQVEKNHEQYADTVSHDVKALHQSAVSALNKGDLEGLMSVYTEDVISMPEGQNPLIGKMAVRQMWKEQLEDYVVQVSVTIEEVESCNDLAFERGTFQMTLNPKAGGQPINNTGKYLDILKRLADGKWKYYRVSFSSNKASG